MLWRLCWGTRAVSHATRQLAGWEHPDVVGYDAPAVLIPADLHREWRYRRRRHAPASLRRRARRQRNQRRYARWMPRPHRQPQPPAPGALIGTCPASPHAGGCGGVIDGMNSFLADWIGFRIFRVLRQLPGKRERYEKFMARMF